MKFFGVTLLAALWAWCAAQAAITPINGVAAVVNDAVITYQDVLTLIRPAVEDLSRQLRGQPDKLAEQFGKARADGLELLVEQQLVLQDFKSTGLNIPENFIEDQIKVRIKERYGDRVSMIKDLQNRGMTYEAFRQQERDRIIMYIMEQRNISLVILISPTKIERYYATNVNKYKVADQIKLRGLVINVAAAGSPAAALKLGQEIIRKIESGTPFTEMASVYSDGSERRVGGDWGWCDRSTLRKGLSDVAFSLNAGQRSGLVGMATGDDRSYWVYQYDAPGKLIALRKYSAEHTVLEERKLDASAASLKDLPEAQEYYLIQVEDKRPAHVRPLAEVQDEIERELIAIERNRLKKRWLDRLRAKAFIRYSP